MSLTDPNWSGTKGKRMPGRPGRFDPSEPLHMTTRRAAKTTKSDGSPSINGSVDGDDSRRGSFDDSRPFTSHSNDSQYSVKSRRTSNGSVPAISPIVAPNGLSHPTESNDADVISPALTPTHQTPSPSRKRKRSSSPMPPRISAPIESPVQSFDTPMDATVTDAPNHNDIVDDIDEVDTVEVVAQNDLSDREISQNSSQSDEELRQQRSFDDQSVDVTPAVSNPASPPSGNSESEEQLTPPQPEDATIEEYVEGEQDEIVDAVDEMDVDIDVEGAEEDEADEQVRSDGEPRPARRFGGRRRARHPIAKVEKAMQRQAELKSAYRTIARAQKAILAEIAQRTVDDLESNPTLHTQTVEYPVVNQELEDVLAERKHQILLQYELCAAQLKQDFEDHQRIAKARCTQNIIDLQDVRMVQMEHQMLRIAREAYMNSGDGEHDTEDENDIIPVPKQEGYRFKIPSKPLDDEYFSRSREYMETARHTDAFEFRNKMRMLLETLPDGERPPQLKRKFTVMDEAPRNAAVARKEATENITTLAQAAKQVERATKKVRVIRNEDAHGLQLLGDLASRPSITAATTDTPPWKDGKAPFPRRASTRPMPPQLQIQTGYRHSPIQIEMSPRTTQALGDRFESSMLPPPTTPRRAPGAPPTLMRSPEATRPEAPLPSPTMNINRFNNPQQPLQRTPDVRPENRRSQFMDISRLTGPEMRPPSEARPEPAFSPIQQSDRRMELPLWREYPRESTGSLHGRSPSNSERPYMNMGMGHPFRDERPNPLGLRMPEPPKPQEPPKDSHPSFGQILNRPSIWQDRLSQPGPPDGRFPDSRSPPNLPPRPTFDAKSPPIPRNPSASFTVRDFRNSGLAPKDDANRQNSSVPINTFKTKTTKDEREGLSRRNWTNLRKASKTSIGSGPAGSPPLAAAAASPLREVPPPPAPWHAPPQHPQHASPVPPPPAPSYQQSPYSQPPPQSSFRPAQQSPDQYSNRNNFPPRPSSSSFDRDRLPPTPLYVMPHQSQGQSQQQQEHPPPPQQQQTQQPLPPPGVPAEQYNRPFAPPPPPGYQPPPAQPPPSVPPHQSPQPPFSQSGPPSSYMSQFGGPTLAPAGGNAYHPPGFRPAPAFAQQAQQQAQQGGGGSSNRRRTQSDAAQFAKFQPWNPPPKR